MEYEDKIKLNGKIKSVTMAVYVVYAVLLIVGVVYFGISTTFGKFNNLFNPFFYFVMTIMAVLYIAHRFYVKKMIEKHNVRFHCSVCNASIEQKELKITPKDGFMCQQKCPRCGRMMYPEAKIRK